jgi:hypothetical protein
MPVHFDPRNPRDNIVGDLPSPASALVSPIGFAIVLFGLAYLVLVGGRGPDWEVRRLPRPLGKQLSSETETLLRWRSPAGSRHRWQCKKCGKQVDDIFDTCWKCETPRDGLSVSVPAADELVATPDVRVVELCSAANEVEAYAILALLANVGIPARVVGKYLGNAVGGLALGEATSPRIWVREEDVRRAREILRQETANPEAGTS